MSIKVLYRQDLQNWLKFSHLNLPFVLWHTLTVWVWVCQTKGLYTFWPFMWAWYAQTEKENRKFWEINVYILMKKLWNSRQSFSPFLSCQFIWYNQREQLHKEAYITFQTRRKNLKIRDEFGTSATIQTGQAQAERKAMEWFTLSHCCYRGQRKHVPAAGIVKRQGHRFLLAFWWTPGRDFAHSPWQEGTLLTVHVKQEIPGRTQSLKWKLSSIPALSGITIKAQLFMKALPQPGSELAGLRICYSCW